MIQIENDEPLTTDHVLESINHLQVVNLKSITIRLVKHPVESTPIDL